MAAGTTFSRFSGFIRSALLVAALGNGIQADTFQVANTVPNMLYILLAGGVFNAVLVPQLVRALKNDADGGEAYTNRIITLAALFLGAVSVLLVALAPAVMALMLDNQYDSAALAAQRESAIVLARYCLPQVFFYGMFVLVGQVLNARGSFGPMMWAPIANNVIAVAVLGTYLVVFGPAADPSSALTAERELLLGVGSTVGIAVQFLILVPVLRRVGFRYRPRFDFRHTGLGHTFRLAVWTVLFVVVNQAAYVVVTRLATRGSADGGTGATVYGNTYLLTMLPHGIVTVSLVTALLPRLSAYAADGSLGRVGTTLASTLRTAMLVVLPYAALLAVIGGDMANVIFGFGAGQGAFASYRPGLAVFAVALVFFTVHFFMLRGFYALEQTRTVFLVQCVVGTVNVGAAIALVAVAPPRMTVAALAAAYALAYLAGSIVSWWVLRRQVGGLDERRTARFAVRMLAVVAISTAISYAVWWLLGGNDPDPTSLGSFLRGAVVGLCQLITYLVLTKVFRIREMAEIIEPVRNAVLRRLGRV
ncbi:murein biosynthesis integral membrane protein MurJ [Nocardioides jishulii]|uniref:Murein biosynthesis integral membrane protein MurJ n=2 Tax=Nocardioides jishulii TaxID=2575440 RepID=A0A4U2YTX8_9ACTN|nr:murein biosynthesis integral membrane protein MurJ [Nocardioides jishulii]TKI64879.1 murein biosynthesis integral membrane protein MurJ [Nocardioides jishulii]